MLEKGQNMNFTLNVIPLNQQSIIVCEADLDLIKGFYSNFTETTELSHWEWQKIVFIPLYVLEGGSQLHVTDKGE